MKRISKRLRNVISRFWSSQKEDFRHLLLLFRREHYPTLLSQGLKQRYRMLTRLKIIDEDCKKQIDHRLVMRYSRELARLTFAEERSHMVVTVLYRTVLLIFILLIGKVSQTAGIRIDTWSSDVDPSTFSGYISEFGLAIILLCLYGLFVFLISPRISFARRLTLFISVLLLGVLYISLPLTGYEVFAFGLVGFHIIILTAIGINTIISQRYDRLVNNDSPEAIIVFNVLLVLHRLDQGALKSYYSKRMFATRLEYAALYMEKYIYKVLKTSDEGTNEWIRERTRQIASGIRDKKKWIYTPKPDTARHLAQSLADFLIHFLQNEWDSLERVEAPKASQKSSWIRQASATARSLVFGLLPISILLYLRQTSIVSVPVSDSTIGIAIIWAIVSILWLDPAAKDKIGALKDATGIIPSRS